VTVIIASDGDASHPDSPTHSAGQLARLRRAEVIQAVSRLAPQATVVMLGLPDGHLDEHRAELGAAIAVHRDAWLVTPWRHDQHPDHEVCAEVAEQLGALELWQYPIWAWHWGDPATFDLSSFARVELSPEARDAKERALLEYPSQHEPLSERPGDEAILPERMLAHFRRPYETFSRIAVAAHPAYFDRLYEQADDPWGLDERFYERRKRAVLVASLPRERFARAFEPGCAGGALTSLLADRCDEVLAADVAPRAVELTRARLADRANVRVEQLQIPDDWPAGAFDLVVLSEVGYYSPDLDALARAAWTSLGPDGVLVACHWRHAADDHPHTAAEVHAALGAGRATVVAHVEADFVLEVWTADAMSVAEREGIVQSP
jgi:SAM-dependent methyltransferase